MKRFYVGVIALACLILFVATGVAGAATSLDVWLVDWTEDTQKLFEEELLPAWNSQHPDVEINMGWVDWGKYDEKLLTAFAGGTAPDIFQIGAEYAWQLATKNQAICIDRYVESWPDREDFFEGSWGTVMWEGKAYGLPYLTAPRAFIYRADILEEIGFEELPETWEELLEVVKLATIRDGSMLVRSGIVTRAHWGQELIALLYAAGGQLLDPDDGTCAINSPAGIAATQFMVDRFNAVHPPGTAELPQSPLPHFATGKQVIAYENQGVINQVQSYAPEKLESVRVGVAVPGGSKYKVPDMSAVRGVALTYTDWIAISTQAKDPDLAWEFMKFLTSSENILKYNRATWGYIPPRISAADNAEYLQTGPYRELLDVFAEYGVAFPSYPEVQRVRQVLEIELELAMNNKKTVAEAVKDMAQGTDKLLREAGWLK